MEKKYINGELAMITYTKEESEKIVQDRINFYTDLFPSMNYILIFVIIGLIINVI